MFGSNGWGYTQNYGRGTLYLVVDVSTDGKFLKVSPFFNTTTHRFNLVQGMTGAGYTWDFNYNPGGRWDGYGNYVNGDATVTQSVVNQHIYTSRGFHSAQSLSDYSYARASSIEQVFDVEDVNPMAFVAHWNVTKKRAYGSWVERMAALDTRVTKSLDYYRPRRREYRREQARIIGQSISKAIECALERDDSNMSYYITRIASGFANTQSEYQPTLDEIIARINAAAGVEISRADGCGHYHTGTSVEMQGVYGVSLHCPHCAANAVSALTGNGETILVPPTYRLHTWSDGTQRVIREPGVINGRHSGKSIVGFVPSLVGAKRDQMITLGMELEMQAFGGTDREMTARQLRNRITLIDEATRRKYVHFEEDGSTGPGGFEMVTGFTDLGTHAALLKQMFENADGTSPWKGKLRSHDAKGGSCGIHVHIQKPKHLVHASKMRYFINHSGSQKLVSDVARRYNDGFARIDNALCRSTPQKLAVQAVKDVKYGTTTRTTANHERMALSRINGGNRYEALNFQNQHTVEFRIFRGTVVYQSMMACLEFTQAVWRFTRDTAATSLTVDNFVAWINRNDNRKDTRNLRLYLSRKGWADVAVPKAQPKLAVAAVPEQAETV
jgi:hypothetical protein